MNQLACDDFFQHHGDARGDQEGLGQTAVVNLDDATQAASGIDHRPVYRLRLGKANVADRFAVVKEHIVTVVGYCGHQVSPYSMSDQLRIERWFRANCRRRQRLLAQNRREGSG